MAVATARTVEEDRLRRSLQAAEAERGRWARELHDETLQALGGLNVLLRSAARSSDPEVLGEAIATATEHVTREIENLRAIITELRPAALDELGLAPALATLVSRVASTSGLEVETEIDINGRLQPEQETTAYRVVQEALSNVVKHAEATKAEVRVAVDDGKLRITVTDDGHGFDPEATTGGSGLVGMRERIDLAGGSLTLGPNDPGTRVEASLPAHARQ
jgi:signal transduction histidine kinase